MQLSKKLAGVFATGAFIIMGLTIFIGNTDPLTFLMALAKGQIAVAVDTTMDRPMKVFTIAVPSAILAGLIGYFIGEVMANPAGPKPSRSGNRPAQNARTVQGSGMTGDETFIDDIEGMPDDLKSSADPPLSADEA